MKARCYCGRPILFKEMHDSIAIYRCMGKDCKFAKDLTEQELIKLAEEQTKGKET